MTLRLDQVDKIVEDIGYEIEEAETKRTRLTDELVTEKEKFEDTTEAINIMVDVLSITQKGVTDFIEDIVSMALQYVYGDEYAFKMGFEMKRNQPEVVLSPTKNGELYNPKYSCGVGILDVCAFALRLALWALTEPRTAPVLIFDEPFKCISSKDQVSKAAVMVKELSDMLDVQIIIVSGKPALVDYADKVFEVEMIDGISYVEEK